jgi:SLOG family YspA-like protein
MRHRSGVVVIVCGGRDYADRGHLFRKLDVFNRRWPIALLRHGAYRGADTLAGEWARSRDVPVDPCPANWRVFGKRAGPLRNGYMLAKDPRPMFVITFPGEDGTADMVSQALAVSGVRVIRVKARPSHRPVWAA